MIAKSSTVSDKKKNEDTYYDFNSEHLLMNVMGGCVILKSPKLYKNVNISLIVFVLLLYSYVFIMGVITMVAMYKASEKILFIRSFYVFANCALAVSIASVKLYHYRDLEEAIAQLKQGIFRYQYCEEENIKIRRKRIRQLRFAVFLITVGMFFSAFSEVVINPFIKYLKGEGSSKRLLHPLLPHSLIVPFDISTSTNFVIAYLSNSISVLFMYCSFASELETYTSCIVQIFVEFEVLNHSISNIKKRALLKLKQSNNVNLNLSDSDEDPYENPDFQRALYDSFRENIMHHQAIVRFKGLLTSFIEVLMCVGIMFVCVLVCCAIVALLEDPLNQSSLLNDVFGFMPLCYCGELIIQITTELGNELYFIPWMSCGEKFKVLLKHMMLQTQKPLVIKAKYFNIIICLEAFANMFIVGYKISNVLNVQNSV